MSEAFIGAYDLTKQIRCDGVLARVISDEMSEVAKTLRCPIVNISNLLRDPGVPSVLRDDRHTGQMCANHLIERGLLRIGIVGLNLSPAHWSYTESLEGFQEMIAQRAPQAEICSFIIDLDQTEDELADRFRTWVRSLKLPSTIFMLDDRFAPQSMSICQELGLRIPQDISFISSFCHPETLNACPVSLTHPEPEGRWSIPTACDLLDKLIKGIRPEKSRIVLKCPRLMVGESTNLFSTEDPWLAKALAFIERGYKGPIKVDDVSKHVKCSRRALERRFKESFNQSIHETLTQKRLDFAIKQLGPGHNKLESVAQESGFGSYNAFRLAFIDRMGTTPNQWIKQRYKRTV